MPEVTWQPSEVLSASEKGGPPKESDQNPKPSTPAQNLPRGLCSSRERMELGALGKG